MFAIIAAAWYGANSPEKEEAEAMLNEEQPKLLADWLLAMLRVRNNPKFSFSRFDIICRYNIDKIG